MHVVIARLCLLLPTPLALSPQKATPIPKTTLAISLQKVTRSICILRCPRRPVPFTASSYTRSEDHANFSSQKAGAAAGEGPIRRPERGGEWELIKILLQRENSAYALNSQPRILTQVCQGHIVTTDLATLGANSKQSQNESETQGAKD
jgi:hypothetical protein